MTTTQQSCTRLATAALFGLLIAVPVVILCRLAAFTPQAEDFHTSLTNWLIVWACLTLFLGLNASTVMDFFLRRGSSLDREAMVLSLLGFANFGVALVALLQPI